MFVQVVTKDPELTVGALDLLFNGFDILGQKTFKVEAAALLTGEGTAFVEQRNFQQNRSGVGNIERTLLIVFF
ncbi:Uncharacterised protein [Klebsiella oxytoca]|nr:Uncharacterised protein [Klebsiella oxytoca]